METSGTWFFWALLSAVFAALTAVFAKIGLTGIDSDLATLVRTGIIAAVLAAFVASTGKWSNPLTLPGKTLLFLLLSPCYRGIVGLLLPRVEDWRGFQGGPSRQTQRCARGRLRRALSS